MFDIAAALVPRVFDLTSLHRFTDPDYAQFTLDLRTGRDPAGLFDRLHALGLVVLHEDADMLRAVVAAERIDGAAITTATNDEARELNALIRENRARGGLVDDARTVEGSDGLSIGGATSSRPAGTTPRWAWRIGRPGSSSTSGTTATCGCATPPPTGRGSAPCDCLRSTSRSTHTWPTQRPPTASRASPPPSPTRSSPTPSAPPGSTSASPAGARQPRLHVVATDLRDAREQFTAALERDHADRGLVEATQRAQAAVSGLTDDGPVREVNAERARLNKHIEKAERLATRWEQAAAAFTDQTKRHKAKEDEQTTILATAENEAQRVRAEVFAPLVVQAAEDGTAVVTAQSRMWQASRAKDAARGFRKRSAVRALDAATAERDTVETTTRRRWGSVPAAATSVEPWAESVTSREAEAHPRVIDQRQLVDAARNAQRELTAQHMEERRRLVHDVFGDLRPGNPREYAAKWRQHAEAARRTLETIEAVPVAEAAHLIRDRAAQEQA